MKIQAIVFEKSNGWTLGSSKSWIDYHNYKPIKGVHETETQYRYRIEDPTHFNRFVTKIIGHKVHIIYGI